MKFDNMQHTVHIWLIIPNMVTGISLENIWNLWTFPIALSMWIRCWATVCVFITSPSLNALWFARNGGMLRCRLAFFSSSPMSKPLSAITASSASISPTATLFLSISKKPLFITISLSEIDPVYNCETKTIPPLASTPIRLLNMFVDL